MSDVCIHVNISFSITPTCPLKLTDASINKDLAQVNGHLHYILARKFHAFIEP